MAQQLSWTLTVCAAALLHAWWLSRSATQAVAFLMENNGEQSLAPASRHNCSGWDLMISCRFTNIVFDISTARFLYLVADETASIEIGCVCITCDHCCLLSSYCRVAADHSGYASTGLVVDLSFKISPVIYLGELQSTD